MEMVDLKFFGEAKAATCIKRQKAAQMAHAPLCVRVDFGGSSTQICLSVFEPEIHSFCRLGRIFVTYNALRNTWHCACAKPRLSCPHKSIAKWHLFQTQRDIFKSTVPLSSGTPSQMTQESSSFEDNAAVERSIRYIFKEKKIPGSLPENVISQKMDHQKQLFPCETLCQVCPEHPKLDEAVVITNKARIVSMMGVTEKRVLSATWSTDTRSGRMSFTTLTTIQFIIVSDLKAPEDFNGERDIEGFWNSIHLEMISRGFFPSGVKNPFSVPPSYTHWASWIGSETRTSDIVLNTEFQKVGTSSSHEAKLSSVTEDRLLDELAKQKVGVVRKLCKACNIDSKGSRFDLITRLREKMKSRQTYDKVFQSIWGASGGWSVILCPHGIVYSVKFNLRAKSPWDFADLLLSWKRMPNVCVYDFARGLAAHTNLWVPDKLPFHPHEGRLAEPTEENVKAAQDGSLKVNLPWLHERMDSVNENPHPVTGSSDHYVLYDRFHEGNTKDPKDILRRIQLVPELKGWLNKPQVRVDNKKANRRSTDATFPDLCGPPCEALTKPENILASRSSWCFVPHTGQQQLLNYVLDISRPKDELIVETSSGCITRADFWTLGLNKQMESTIENGCFELITKIVQSKGISIYIENLYVTRTWLAPYGCDPLQSFPTDAQRMDIIVLPLWTPGHFQLCVLKPPKREILFFDPLYTKAGFGGQQYVSLLRNLAVKIIPGQWSEKKSFDLKGFPSQDYGVDCGIFMLMSALYVALDAPFDYTILWQAICTLERGSQSCA
ncbi:unnamed protein product [Oreochromis niloticus]|nr:unnamed protein product [Mustela putorius furo]